jgi:hypothetical protein
MPREDVEREGIGIERFDAKENKNNLGSRPAAPKKGKGKGKGKGTGLQARASVSASSAATDAAVPRARKQRSLLNLCQM